MLQGHLSGNTWELEWTSTPDISYLVQRSEDLLTWSVRGVITPDGTAATYSESVMAATPHEYFRLMMPQP